LSGVKNKDYKNTVVSFNESDDAAVVKISNGKLLVQTVDFFTPVVDDPYIFGQIAAANALSDIYAMGATPTFALNIFGFPINELSKDIAIEILKGGSDKTNEAGIPILGGHSIDDKEPKYGLVVNGEVFEDKLIRNSGSLAGDSLILTKPLGTGIITTAIKKGQVRNEFEEIAIESMKTLNKDASKIMNQYEVNAATDVTGYGLLGHLVELCKSSGVSAEVEFSNVSFFSGTEELAKNGFIPSGSKRNYEYISKFCNFSKTLSINQKMMLSDAQTSGGLLISIPSNQAEDYIKNINSISEIKSTIIGRITDPSSSLIKIL